MLILFRLLVLLLLINSETFAQNISNRADLSFFVNPSVINQSEPEIVQVLNIWRNYLRTKDSLYHPNPYWSRLEHEKHVIPDIFYKRVDYSVSRKQKFFYKPTVLYVEKKDSSYIMKTLFAHVDKNSEFIYVSSIINVEVIKEDGKWKLKSMLDRNLKNYYQYKVGHIKYYAHNNRVLDTTLCYKFDAQNKIIAKKFGVSPLFITYYLCLDNREIQSLQGYDFEFSMAFPNQIAGLADIFNNAIYAGNNSEWYPHELVHLYVNDSFGTNVNECFNEGLSTYIGGSLGYYLQYHLHKIAVYVKDHPVDFTKLSSLERIDDVTNFQYTIGGLLCKIVDEQLGFSGVKKLLKTGNTDAELVKTMELIMNIKATDFNKFIYKELKKYE